MASAMLALIDRVVSSAEARRIAVDHVTASGLLPVPVVNFIQPKYRFWTPTWETDLPVSRASMTLVLLTTVVRLILSGHTTGRRRWSDSPPQLVQ